MGLNDLNSFLDDVEKGDKISSVGLSMMKAHGTNPDKYAQLKKLEQQTGRPAQWMADDPTIEQDAQRSIDLDGKKWEMLASHAPKVANYYTDPEKAKVSIDDHENLSAIEKTFDVIKRSGGSLAASLWSTSEGLWGVPRAAGDLLQGVTKPLADATGLPLDIGGAIAEYAKKEQHYAGQWAAWARGDNSKLGGFENSVYQGFESLGGNLLLAPITIASGTPTPMLAGMSGSAGGKSYGEARDKNLSPMTSLVHGTSQGAIEYATEMIPAMRFVEAMNGKTLFSKAIKGVLGADIVGEQYATVLQDLNDWATLNPEKPFKAYLEERPSAAAQTLVATIVGTGGMVATAKGIQAAGQSFEKHLEAKQQSDFLIALGDSVKASKTFARLPENIKELVREIKQDGDIQDVFIPVEKLNQLFQSKGLDAGQQMDQILTDPKRYYEALATGGDVAIPLEDFAALAGDEIYSELVGDARLKLDGISSNEAATLNDPATKEKMLNDLLSQVEESDTPPIEGVQKEAYQRFYDDTYGQLIGIGRNPEQSDKESILRAKLLSTLMQRGGYTEDYLNQMFPVSITRGALPDALGKQKTADTVGFESRIGEMLDQLRNGKAPKESEIFGKSLLEFLRDKGLQDQGGELKGFELDRGQKFKKKIVRTDGLTLDMARESAAEAGYLPMESSVADFLDLLDSESRGNAVYSQQSGNQALLDKKLELDQLQEWLDAMDVDLSQADNSSLLQLMQKSVEGERLNQTDRGSAEGAEAYSVTKTLKLGMLVPAVLKDGVVTAAGIGATHYDVHKVMKADIGDKVDVTGFITPDGKFLDRKESNEWLKENRPDIYKRLDKVTKENGLESQAYANAEGVTSQSSNAAADFLKRHFGTATTFFQSTDTKRGYIQFTRGVPGFEIALLKDANASTFIHETGHYYFEIMRHLASQENVPQQIADDFNSLLKWLGAENSETLTVKQLEQLADGFTEYLSEGNAPSVELQGVFSRFKVWLQAIYMTFKNADVEMTDEVRGIFDRWLATDEEIAAAQDRVQAKPMFSTAQDAGMSERVFTAYKKLAEEAHEAARTRLDTQKYKEANRIHQQWWKEAHAAMSAEVEAEAKENPVYEVLNFIRTGKLFDGSAFEGESSRLDGNALKRMYDSATLKGFSKKLGIFYQNEGGVNPEDAAQMFGFGSADEMIRKMVEAPKMKEWVKAETDRRMLETYPEKNSTEIADDALAAVNNDDLAKVFREELRAIKRKVKEVKPFVDAENSAKREGMKEAFDSIPPLDYFRDAAKQHIAGLKIAELQPYRFALAEAKAGKEALTENGKGNYAKAAAAKQRQILNHYLYREALNAQEMADKAVTYMRKLDSKKKQQALGKAGQEYLDQINNLLEQYEFKQVPLYYLAERERLLDWIYRKEAETGQTFPIDPVVLADAKTVNYKTLTVDVLNEVYRMAKVIDFLAMNHNKLVKDQQKRDLMDVADEVAASIELHGGKKKKRTIEKGLPQDAPLRQLKNYFSGMRAMSSIARQMDGGADGGLVWNTLIRPLNEAADKEAAMSSKATEEADRIFSVYSAVERSTMTIRRLVPGTDINLSHWGRLMVALNMGNEGNRDRLLATFDTQEVAAILDTLDERDFQVVQNTWDWISSFKPEIAAKEKRVNGIEPEWVDATPLETKFGILAGGYFPIFYDLDESERADAQNETTIAAQMKGGAFAHASTRRGHLEARLNHLNRKLDFGIENVFRHVNQVIHDISHHEALIDINNVLGMDSIQDAMRDYHGTEAYKIFRDGVTDVAVGSAPARNAFEKFMQYTRIGSTVAALGWNVSTSLLQPLGLSQSIVRIGAEWTAKGVMKWLGSPKHMIGVAEQIYDKSTFMRERSKTMNRELAEVSQKLQPGVVPGVVKDSFFYLIQATQKMVDIPTWLGQYEKSMAAHGNEADAIAEADQAVIDAQAHGQVKDLARFQRGAPLMKAFTMFSSYFFRTWNLTAESAAATSFKNPAEMGKFIVDLTMLYVVPAAISAAVFDVAIQSAIGGDPDEDKFWMGFYSKIIGGVINPFPGLNQMNSLVSGFNGYEGPAGARIFAEVGKFAKQAGQGEVDTAFWKSANNLGGIIGQYPAGQINKTVQGMIELSEGRGNALSLMFGKPKK